MLGPLTSYFFSDQFLRVDMYLKRGFENFYGFNTLVIKHYNLSIYKWYCYVFFSYVISNLSSLNFYGYNSKEEVGTTCGNVDFLFNLEHIPRSSKQALGTV